MLTRFEPITFHWGSEFDNFIGLSIQVKSIDTRELIGHQRRFMAGVDIEDVLNLPYLAHGSSYHDFQDGEVRGIREGLLAWYRIHRRRLPWRGDQPPFTKTSKITSRLKPCTVAAIPQVLMIDLSMSSDEEEETEEAEDPSLDVTSVAMEPDTTSQELRVTPYATWVNLDCLFP